MTENVLIALIPALLGGFLGNLLSDLTASSGWQ